MSAFDIIFSKIPTKKLNFIVVLCGILADLLITIMLYLKICDFSYFQKIFFQVLMAKGIDPQIVSQEMMQEYFHLIANTTLTLLVLFFLFHLVIYLCAYKKKLFSLRYLQLYFATGLLGFTGLALTSIVSSATWFAFSMVEIILFLLALISLRRAQREE